MYFHADLCCLCLNNSNETPHHLNDVGAFSYVSYYEKITSSLSKLVFNNEFVNDYVLCMKCCSIIDNVYEFNKNCLRNIDIMTRYKTEIKSSNNIQSELDTRLTDSRNTLTNYEERIKFEDVVTSEVTDVMHRNIVPESEKLQDCDSLTFHQSSEAYVPTEEVYNDFKVECSEDKNHELIVEEERLNDINIKDGVCNIKIEEPSFDNNLKYADGESRNLTYSTISPEENVCSNEPTYLGANFSIGTQSNTGCNASSNVTERTQIGSDTYVCDICNLPCLHRSSLLVHKRRHTGERPFICEVCNKGFTQMGNLIIHKRTHTLKRPYVCDVCNKGFTVNSSLILHKRLHTGEKPYVCDVCNKQFAQNGDLAKHKRVHTGEKPYVCDVCNKSFSQTVNLATHKRTHTGVKPYVCDVCSKRFGNNGELVRHKRIHTGDKPYVCEVCNKGFTQKENLATHKRIHTGEMPYGCDVCNMRFNYRGHLVKHKLNHTLAS